jgi:hypothetical protein
MKSKKGRILFAAVDIGYRIEHYSKFIREHYHEHLEAESFSKYVLPESHYKTSYTYTCEIYKKSKLYVYCYITCFFIYSLFRFDIFHFLSGETILTRKLRRFELATYKLFGKKVIMHFVGADIRSNKYLKWKNDHLKDFLSNNLGKFPPITEPFQDKLIADANKYADEIIVSTPDLLKIIPQAKFYPVIIDFDKFISEFGGINNLKSKDKICIIHSPSNSSIKGSEQIYFILENIRNKFADNVSLILPGKTKSNKYYSTTRYELIELCKQSNILIDQLTIGWYGLQVIEAIITGNQVFCYIAEDLKKYLFEGTPIINVNANNFEHTLTEFINTSKSGFSDFDYIKNIEWIKKHHTIENNNEILRKAWEIN